MGDAQLKTALLHSCFVVLLSSPHASVPSSYICPAAKDFDIAIREFLESILDFDFPILKLLHLYSRRRAIVDAGKYQHWPLVIARFHCDTYQSHYEKKLNFTWTF